MKLNLKAQVILAIVLLALLVYPLGCKKEEPQELNGEVVIAQAGNVFVYAPLYVAIDGGFFAEEGLNVRLITTGGDEKTWAAVISGEAHFGVADPTFVAISAQRGQPGKVIASILDEVPFWGVTIDPNIPNISSGKDLNGYSVATFPSPSTAYALQQNMFVKGGLQPNIREGAFGNLLPMLQSGRVDIALELEPNVSVAVAQGARVIYSLNKIYKSFATTGITTTDSMLIKNPVLVKSVVRAIQKSLNYINADLNGTLKIMNKRFPELELGISRSALQRLRSESIFADNVMIAQDGWKQAVQLRVDIGHIKTLGKFSDYVDNSFAEKAFEECSRASGIK